MLLSAGPLGAQRRTAPAVANIRYELTFDSTTARQRTVRVGMRFDAMGTAPVLLSLPAWTPGSYEISNYARKVSGFAVTGGGRAESDLDLAVDAGRRLTAAEKMALISELAGRIGRPVDLVDIHAIGEPLLGQILRHGKRILGSDTHYANLVRRHVFDQADYLPYRNRILAERRQAWIGK
mgnify:CR=1 FL=1